VKSLKLRVLLYVFEDLKKEINCTIKYYIMIQIILYIHIY